jgi:hypothetical protein
LTDFLFPEPPNLLLAFKCFAVSCGSQWSRRLPTIAEKLEPPFPDRWLHTSQNPKLIQVSTKYVHVK